MVSARQAASGALFGAAVSFGCVIAAFTLIGGPLIVAYFRLSVLWLFVPVLYLSFGNGRWRVAQNQLESVRPAFLILVNFVLIPITFAFGIEWLLYKLAALLIRALAP